MEQRDRFSSQTGFDWLVLNEQIVLEYLVLLAFGQQDIFDTYNFIYFFLLLYSMCR